MTALVLCVKTWKFANSAFQVQSGKLLSLVHVRTLKMSDDVLAVRYSPNNKLLAVALLDSTVKVFYQDTLKFFLSLYGHKVRIYLILVLLDLPMKYAIAPSTLHGYL
jgi:U3 small nucleolar RNA-associated protein 12